MNTLKRDGSKLNTIGLAPIGIENVAADTEIDHLAITVSEAATIYFTDAPAMTMAVDGMTTLVVSSNLRLSAQTKCLVY